MWSNEELIGMIRQQQELTVTMLRKITPDEQIEELLEKVIENQREADHLIDGIIESDIVGSDISQIVAMESADTAEQSEKLSQSSVAENCDLMSDSTE